MALVLAERSLGVPQLLDYLKMHAILTLDMISDHTNADRFAVKVTCGMFPADLATILFNPHSVDVREYLLSVSDLTRIPLAEAPARMRIVAENIHRKLALAQSSDRVLALYFATKSDATGEDGSFCAAYPLSTRLLSFMASEPSTIISGLFGDVRVDLNMENLLDCFNHYIYMDKDNKLRLRTSRK